jgi:hypothetical protein
MPRPLPDPYLVPHQTRSAPPTEWEDSLADAIEAGFAAGHWELDALVAFVRERGVRDPHGSEWTVESFQAELARLGD